VPPNTDFCKGYDYGGKADLSKGFGIEKENVGNHAFFTDI